MKIKREPFPWVFLWRVVDDGGAVVIAGLVSQTAARKAAEHVTRLQAEAGIGNHCLPVLDKSEDGITPSMD